MKKLYRSNKNKMIAGICGGIAETYSWDPTIIRLLFVFLTLITKGFPLLVTYLIAWLIIPIRKTRPQHPRHQHPKSDQ